MKRTAVLLFLCITFICCSKTEEIDNHQIFLDTYTKTVAAGDEFSIKAISDLPVTYQSNHNFHATIDSINPWNNATIKAGYVGQTTINVSNGIDTKEVKLIVSPQINLFNTPATDKFGTSKEELMLLLGSPSTNNNSQITYSNYSKQLPLITYQFNNNNLLSSIGVKVLNNQPELIRKFLLERYRFAGFAYNQNVGNVLVFYNSLKNTTPTLAVYLYSLDNNYDAIVYQPYNIEIEDTESTKIINTKFLSLP